MKGLKLNENRTKIMLIKGNLNENRTEIMLIMGNLRTNVTHEFGNFDVEASTLVPVNSE